MTQRARMEQVINHPFFYDDMFSQGYPRYNEFISSTTVSKTFSKIRELLMIRILLIHPLFQHGSLYFYLAVAKERDRFNFLNPLLSPSTKMAGFASSFSKVHEQHCTKLFCRWHLLFLIQSVQYVLPSAISISSSVADLLFFHPFQS